MKTVISRRDDETQRVPAENAITQAMLEIELMPSSPELSEATSLLTQAREKVSDFIDRELALKAFEEATPATDDTPAPDF